MKTMRKKETKEKKTRGKKKEEEVGEGEERVEKRR